MRIRLLLFLITLFIGSWPNTLLAYAPAQLPQTSSPSSFLLVASRKLADPRFRESVIMVTRRGHSGPIGVIINRPRDIALDTIFPDAPAAKEFKLFEGGPVDVRHISFLFRNGQAAPGTLQLSEHLYLSYDMALLGGLLDGTRTHDVLRVVNGFAAWAPRQLENEIARGDWFMLPFDERAIFERPASGMWAELYRRASPAP